MFQAHFNEIRKEIMTRLNGAKSEVNIAMAWFTSAELFNTLLSCLSRKVRVNLVLLDNYINFMEYAPNFNDFIEAGGKLYIFKASHGFMHHKFCVVDGKIVISGSYNWTYYAETRNIENILVTDDSSAAVKYTNEFNRLCSLAPICDKAPRLSLADIETYDDVDYKELNYEIDNICHSQGRPVVKVLEAHTQVTVQDLKLTPVSKRNIGILTEGDKFTPFVNSGTKLPARSSDKDLYFDTNESSVCPCKIVQIDSGDNCTLIKEEDILQIAGNVSDTDLKLSISMKLDDNGQLRADIFCQKSNKRLTISTLDKDLIKYV
jgi:phosphatidylserine/phosphatidylglycerophosphate/cardiolipin synthase-like enzyme